jgi:hypothetical protein
MFIIFKIKSEIGFFWVYYNFFKMKTQKSQESRVKNQMGDEANITKISL